MWSATYPEKGEDFFLLSGFLSAINTFAKESEGKSIRNICIGDDRWVFTKIYGIDNLLLVAQFPIPSDIFARFLDLMLSEQFLSEILMEFTKHYSSDKILDFSGKISFFDDMGIWVKEKLEKYDQLLKRSNKCDLLWLAHFKESEKLFTAILSNLPMYLIRDTPDSQEDSEELEKFQATIEVLCHSQITATENISSIEALKIHKISPGNTIYLINRTLIESMMNSEGVIVDTFSRKVIKGPDPNPLASKLTFELRHLSSPGDTRAILESLLRFVNRETDLLDMSLEFKEDTKQTGLNFRCNLCNAPMHFKINDSSSYLTKKNTRNFS